MQVFIKEKDNVTIISLKGELDHHAAKETITEIGRIIDARLPMQCMLDMSGVSFMDSSGIAVLLGTYKRIEQLGGKFEVKDLNKQAERVVRAAGLSKIFPIHNHINN